MKGIYSLIVRVEQEKRIEVGKLGEILFDDGFYIYVGSAQSNLEKRISRHLSDDKNMHWHIDYLLEHGDIEKVLAFKKEKSWECKLADLLSSHFKKIKDFGSSDCSCASHLYYTQDSLSIICDHIKSSIKGKTITLKDLDIQ